MLALAATLLCTLAALAHAAYHAAPPLDVSSSLEVQRIVLQRALPASSYTSMDDMRVPSSSSRRAASRVEFESRSYNLAVFTVEAGSSGAEVYGAASIDDPHAAPTPLHSTPVHGLTRLICRGNHPMVFESYPAPNRLRHSYHASQTELEQEREKILREARARAGAPTDADKRAAAGMGAGSAGAEDDEMLLGETPTISMQAGPSVFLVPLHGREMENAIRRAQTQMDRQQEEDESEDDIHPIYRLLALDRSSRLNSTSSGTLEFALLTSYRYGGLGNLPKQVIPPRELRGCAIKFLKEAQQIHRQRGHQREAGAYVVPTSVAGTAQVAMTPFLGDVQFRRRSSAVAAPSVSDSSLSQSAVPAAVLRDSWSILRPFVFSAASADPWPQVSPAPGSSGSDPSAADLLNSPECQFDVDGSTVFLADDARTYGTVASQTRDAMGGVVKPVVAAVVGAFQSIVGGFVLVAAQEFLPSAVSDSVVESVTREASTMMAQRIVPSIGQRMRASLAPVTANKLEPYASHGISYKTTADIVESLTKNLVRNIHHLIDAELPHTLAILHAQIVPHLLDRAVTHSVTAALTHSLSHSPLHDSFCQVCAQDQKQCEFCHFSQQKITYGLYYAGYFSTYYSDYYAGYFKGIEHTNRIRELEPAQQNTRDRLRYRRIYSDRGDEVPRTWRTGYPQQQ